MNIRTCSVLTVIGLGLAHTAYANVGQLKIYRAVYPDFKPQCGYCHVSEKPKKDDGQHDLNAYGMKAKDMAGEPTEDIYKTLGPHTEFKADEAGDAAGK